MHTLFKYQVIRLFRDKMVLIWAFIFPVILSLLFMAMFSGLANSYAVHAINFGVVTESAYNKAPGLSTLIDKISDAQGEDYLIDTTSFSSAQEAEEAVSEGSIAGYLNVDDNNPVIHVTPSLSETEQTAVPIIKAVMTSYIQTRDQAESLAENGKLNAQALAQLQTSHISTEREQITQAPSDPQVRYYFSLLAFACGMGVMVSLAATQDALPDASKLGARRAMAGIPRWRVLASMFMGSWLCTLVCLLFAFYFIRIVVGINFGEHVELCHIAIAAASFMSCAAGMALGTFKRMASGIVSGVVCLLSLFTGLYGSAAMSFASTFEQNHPLLASLNPLWQTAHCFYDLLYYDTLDPFFQNCAALLIMAAVFFTVALVRMRRMSYARL